MSLCDNQIKIQAMNASFVQEDTLEIVFYTSDLIICKALGIQFSFSSSFLLIEFLVPGSICKKDLFVHGFGCCEMSSSNIFILHKIFWLSSDGVQEKNINVMNRVAYYHICLEAKSSCGS